MNKILGQVRSPHERAFINAAGNLARYFRLSDLEGVAIVGVQHLVGTNFRMFRWLVEDLKLPAANVHLLGKCYSTDSASVALFMELGIRVSADSCIYNPCRPFHKYFRAAVDTFWTEAMQALSDRPIEVVIVLDDGAHLIRRALADNPSRERYPMIGIEQTSAGFRSLEDFAPMAIVNVARSHLKLADEAKLIAVSVVDRALERIPQDPSALGLVLGAGVVGARVAERLRQCGRNIHVADIVSNRSEMPMAILRNQLAQYSYIIGATGEPSIRQRDLPLLRHDCILMSASSGDIEFPASSIRSRGGQPTSDCHSDVTADGVVLANCGFPINFCADADLTDPEPMFLTRGLILAAILQCVATSSKPPNGWIPLDTEAAILVQREHVRVSRKMEYQWVRRASPTEDLFLERLEELNGFNDVFKEVAQNSFVDSRLEGIRSYGGKIGYCFRDPSIVFLDDGGLRSATNEYLNFGRYEDDELSVVLQIIAECQKGVVLDLGAHIGWYGLSIAARFLARLVHCFEPMPATHGVLRKNIELNCLTNVRTLDSFTVLCIRSLRLPCTCCQRTMSTMK
jgi:hypothetical protein